MKTSHVLVAVLVLLCLALGAWSLFLLNKISHREESAHYYETSEWSQGTSGVQFNQTDEKMDSLVYIPGRNKVCWFHGRIVADVQPNGTFLLKWPNGGRMTGVVRPLDKHIELVGFPGTSEDGVVEKMILSD
jgi:hypothetical protein